MTQAKCSSDPSQRLVLQLEILTDGLQIGTKAEQEIDVSIWRVEPDNLISSSPSDADGPHALLLVILSMVFENFDPHDVEFCDGVSLTR